MKKLLLLAFSALLLFGASTQDIEKKLNYLIQRMNKMEKQLNSKDREIKQLKQEVKKQKIETKKEFMVNSCDKIKVKDFSYIYDSTLLPYYDLTFSLQNDYPYDIAQVSGKLYVKDISDDIKIFTQIVDKKVIIKKSGGKATIQARHPVSGQLDKVLKDEPSNNIKVIFSPSTITFTNGKKVSCGGIFSGIGF